MKKAFLFVLFGIIFSFFSQSNTASAAFAIDSHFSEEKDTYIDFTIYIDTGYTKGIGVSCTDPEKKSVNTTATFTQKDSAKPLDKYTARCLSLSPETAYTYAIYASDGASFSTKTGSVKTLSKIDLTPKPEVYKMEGSTVISQKDGKFIATSKVGIVNPMPNGAYSVNIGKPKNNNACTFLPEYRIEKRVDKASADKKLFIIETSWPLSEGIYCLGIEKEVLVVKPAFITAVEVLETFAVGGKFVSTPPTPNENGCIENGTDEYCAMATLPGIGEVDAQGRNTGKISLSRCFVDGVEIQGEPGFGCYLNNILRLVMGIIIIISIVVIIASGIEAMTSQNGEKKVTWKGRMRGAVLGLVLALSSYLILNTLNNKLVNLGVTLPSPVLELNPDGPSEKTIASSSLNGTQVTAFDALCKQVTGVVPVKVKIGADATSQDFKMPIKSGYPWPSDNGKIVTISATQLGLLSSAFEGKILSILPGNERTRLEQAGVEVKDPESLTAGSSGTTSVYGLPEASIQGLIRLKKACNCEVVVTGGTECWAHKSHGPGLQPVDLRKTESLKVFIYNQNNTKKSNKDYIWGSTVIFDEDSAHFHVRSW